MNVSEIRHKRISHFHFAFATGSGRHCACRVCRGPSARSRQICLPCFLVICICESTVVCQEFIHSMYKVTQKIEELGGTLCLVCPIRDRDRFSIHAASRAGPREYSTTDYPRPQSPPTRPGRSGTSHITDKLISPSVVCGAGIWKLCRRQSPHENRRP